jgi:RimJ/RimL family protein N-acetyltransferase
MLLSGDLSQTSLTSERLTLRAAAPTDRAEVFAESTAGIATYMSWDPPSEMEHRALWASLPAAMQAGQHLFLVIRRADTSEFIGMTSLHPADGDMLETGIWIKETAQGLGYGREAVAAVVRWAGGAFGAGGFLWPVVAENAPSRRLVEALGATIIGTEQRPKPGEPGRTVLLYCVPVDSSNGARKSPD